jgi:hypothetical protein
MPTSFLDDVLANALALLGEGVADAASPFRTPTLAGVDADGWPALRSVVLRGFDNAARCLEMHTDTRSAKVAAFEQRPAAALHVWDAARRVQVRVRGAVRLHAGDEVAKAAWGRLQPGSRATYCVEPGPGTAIKSPHDTHARGEQEGFSVFCVLHMHFDALEWLHLEHGHHRRALFRWENGVLTPMWRVP